LASSLEARVLDNFDGASKTDWTDFSFIPQLAYGVPTQQDGMLKFELDNVGAIVGGGIFSASQKTSEAFELKEGRTIEFRVDVIQGGAKDSFAILGFVPKNMSPKTLGGYGFAKSTTDALITKGINKYFVADAGAPAHLKQDNITMVLSLTAKGGNVIIHAQALDKDADNAVLWDRTVVDTPGADPLAGGAADDPPAPYITSGYFTLYLYADYDSGAEEHPYKAYYDNAEVYVTDTTVLDDFDDGVKTGWTDFTFIPPLAYGVPVEQNGQFQFELPNVGDIVGGGIFSASQKTSRLFDLREGERLTFSIDVVQGGAKDSFAILGFVPKDSSPKTLGGYGFAKSTTDVLITKGINKYFVADAGAPAHLKQDNITMTMTLTAKEGSVIIHATALDKDADNAVLWDRTVIDTPGADPLAGGAADNPPAPYITSGYFTLYLYADYDSGAPENPYKAYYDNAIVSAAPPPSNSEPNISPDTTPLAYSNFLPAATDVSFSVVDDKDLSDDNLALSLNGVTYTKVNGLIVTGTGHSRQATLHGKLASNVNYAAKFSVTDSDGVTATKTIYFDTFDADSTAAIVVEVEDYNFSSGGYFDNPTPISEGSGPQDGSYSLQTGVQGVDFNDTRTGPHGVDTRYRNPDPVRMQHTLDFQRSKFVDAGGTDNGVYDYDVGDIVAGEWMNYTRTFPAGSYEVYLRESVVNMVSGDSALELVTGDSTQPDQTVKQLGTFLGVGTGFSYRTFALTDGTGLNKARVNLSGTTTLRLRQITSDASGSGRFQTYLLFLRVGDLVQQQPPIITSLIPAPDTSVETLSPAVSVSIQNNDTAANLGTLKLVINGATVTPLVTPTATGATVSYSFPDLPDKGATNTATVSFKDTLNNTISSTWSFVITYKSMNPAWRVDGTPGTPGWGVHVVQAPAGSNLANSINRAEDQIKNGSTIPRAVDVTDTAVMLNYNKKSTVDNHRTSGVFPDDLPVPGIDPATTGNGLDDFTAEMVAYVRLEKGIYRFGVISDDGYKLSGGRNLHDPDNALGFHTDGVANDRLEFYVPASGLYPMRALWYERGGEGYFELFSEDRATGEQILLNDPDNAGSIKAYMDVVLPTIGLQSSAAVSGPYADEAGAVVDAGAKSVTVSPAGEARFYRLTGTSALHIKGIQLKGGKAVLTYE